MRHVYINAADSWEEADEHFEQFLAVVPERRLQLAEWVAATGGPVLDRSVESLGPVNEWFIETVLDRPAPPDVEYRPAWMPPRNPDWRPNPTNPRAAPGWLYLLWEQVAVYVGDVMIEQVPGSRWVCWRAKHKGVIDNGMPVIDFGVPDRPFNAITCANGGVLRSWTHQGTGNDMDVRPAPSKIRGYFVAELARREAHFAEHPARWKVAPTGPGARRSQRTPATSP